LVKQSKKSKPSSDGEAVENDTSNQLRVLNHDLVERIKELNCLYGISRLVEKNAISLDSVLQGVVDLIPPAWQYPKVTCARIKLRDREFKTINFKITAWEQAETIVVNSRKVGTLEIYYLAKKPWVYEGPFLKEERDLVHGIAERLGHIIESTKAEITLQKLYAREKRLRRKLQSEMQNRVLYTRQLIHELKTPLTSLLATSQLLSEETQRTRLEKLAGYVWEGATGLNSRIDELHDVIKGETGKLKLELKSLNIKQLLTMLIDETKALSRAQGVSVKLMIDERKLPAVMADAERVRQILLNLINNAYKYASAGKEINIRAACDRSANSVIIEVRDFGPGISKDKSRGIFKPGYQKTDHHDTRGGLGIGLPLCKALVELHGGRIWVTSPAGGGTSVFFTIPIAADD
jgi:signal transduction histidine kinase